MCLLIWFSYLVPTPLVHYIVMSPKLNMYSMIYHIDGNFCGRKLSENKIFTEKTFADCSLVLLPKDATAPNFRENFFANSYKTLKSAKVFSLKIFPLYNTKSS